MQVGALDLGTNTFHLLLAEVDGGRIEVQARHKATVHLGREASAQRWHISPAAEERARAALQDFANILKEARPSQFMSVATAAFRMDPEGKAIAQRLQRATGISIRIISGEEEAQLIYEGTRAGLPKGTATLLLDIGGGSMECTIGDSKHIQWQKSFSVGVQQLLHAFFKEDPMPPAAQAALSARLQQVLQPLCRALEQHRPRFLLGTSGTFTTLYAMYAAEQSLAPLGNTCGLSMEYLQHICYMLPKISKTKRLALPGMAKARVDMLVLGVQIIRFLLQEHTFEEVLVSACSLKEGLLQRLARTTT